MSNSWTEEEFEEFAHISDNLSSPDQCDRIGARMDMPRFVEKHGKEKCDLMFEELTKDE